MRIAHFNLWFSITTIILFKKCCKREYTLIADFWNSLLAEIDCEIFNILADKKNRKKWSEK